MQTDETQLSILTSINLYQDLHPTAEPLFTAGYYAEGPLSGLPLPHPHDTFTPRTRTLNDMLVVALENCFEASAVVHKSVLLDSSDEGRLFAIQYELFAESPAWMLARVTNHVCF